MTNKQMQIDVNRLRSAMVAGGIDPEQINDLVMRLGAKNFVSQVGPYFSALQRATELYQTFDKDEIIVALMQREQVLYLLGIDPTSEEIHGKLMGRLVHLSIHANDVECSLAEEVLSRAQFKNT